MTQQPHDLPAFDTLALLEEPDPATAPAAPSHRAPREPVAAPSKAEPAPMDSVDWAAVQRIRNAISETLVDEDLSATTEDAQARALSLISHHLDDEEGVRIDRGQERWTNAERRALTKAVLQSLFHFGRLQPLLDDPTIENIEIYGFDDVLIQRADGTFDKAAPIAESDEDLLATIATWAHAVEHSFDPAHPRLHMSLGTNARLQAIGWVVDRPIVTIRIHRLVDVDLDSLVELDLMPPALADFLRASVRANKSIMVAGAQGAGKTTLLRGLINEIDPWEKIATLESTFELHLSQLGPQRHRRLISLEAVPGSDEKDAYGRRIGEITLDDWARDTFRMNLDRLIVGEILGPEVIAMFEAMQTGNGSLSTIHAKSAAAVPERIVTLARKDGRVTEDFARRQVAENIDMVIYVDLHQEFSTAEGTRRKVRRITDVRAYEPGEKGQVASSAIWAMENGELIEKIRPTWYDDLLPFLGNH